jgi:formylglycine-generating enzyme required for sulfatase activity
MTRKIALVIGNNEYSDLHLSQLLAPDVDIQAIQRVLQDPEIGAFDEVVTLSNSNVDVARIAIARLFTRKQREDLLFLYFSGHGVLDEHGRLYLALRDTERDLLSATALSASFITDEMDRSHSRRQVLILDCCHSGAFERGTKGILGASVGTASAFEGSGYGRAVLTATDSTQYAWEGEQILASHPESSVFTHFLVDGLETGLADVDNDGVVTIDDLFSYVYQEVVKHTPKQTPGKWTYKQQGDLVIAKNRHPRPMPIPTSSDIDGVMPEPRAPVFVPRAGHSQDGTVFSQIPSGEFAMGATKYPDERPVHLVKFLRPFFMATTLVTNSQYMEFCKRTGYKGQHKNFLLHLKRDFFEKPWKHPHAPVAFISWYDAKEYILWRCERDDRDYRLPTEAQWEYACRAGTRTVYYWGNAYEPKALNSDQTLNHPTPVKTYPPNPWGLYDMLGNLWEWTEDVKDVLPKEESIFFHNCVDLSECIDPVNTDPEPITSNRVELGLRVIRGGSWYSKSFNVRPANRRGQVQDECLRSIGFRLVAHDVPEKEIQALVKGGS